MMDAEYLGQLHQLLDTRFSNEELHILCFDLGVDYDDLEGQSQAGKALALVNYCDRHNLIPKLAEVGRRLRSDIEWPDPPAAPPRPATKPTTGRLDANLDRRNQLILLKKVYAAWIEGILEPSIQRSRQWRVGMDATETASPYPWQMLTRSAGAPPQPLPPGTRLHQVFTGAKGGLLILGAPGSGKTTTLLDLARDLISEAEQDAAHQLPVIFNLSSWAAERPPLGAWLAEELHLHYDVPRTIAQVWVEENRILPLLDGLDEVEAEQRSACVQAINVFQRDHSSAPLVVCSRAADYEALAARLNLTDAVILQPLAPEYVEAYLDAAGPALGALRDRITHDPMLHELAQSPLMLHLMTLAYQDAPAITLPQASDIEQQRLHIVSDYVGRMTKDSKGDTAYSQAQIRRWLSWLAKTLDQRADTLFHVERLQPDWLATRSMQLVYGLLDRLGMALLMALAVTLILGPDSNWSAQLDWTVAAVLIGGLFGGTGEGLASSSRRMRLIGFAFLGWLLVGVVVGMVSGWQGGLNGEPVGGFMSGITGAWFGGLFGGLAGLLAGPPSLSPRRVILVDPLQWSGLKAATVGVVGLAVMVGIGIVMGLPIGMVYGNYVGLIFGVLLGLLLGADFVLVGILIGGWRGGLVDSRLRPNEGIRRSVSIAIKVGLVLAVVYSLAHGLTIGLVLGLIFEMAKAMDASSQLTVGLGRGVTLGLGGGVRMGLFLGLISSLAYGGYACLSHLALRFILQRQGALPWNVAAFLNFATDRLLLHKVGSGYIFVHRFVQDYFAAQQSDLVS